VKRLQEKYDVNIRFARPASESDDTASQVSSTERLSLTPGCISLKGNKDDVESVRREITDLIAWEESISYALGFLIPKFSIRNVVGRNGIRLNQMKLEAAAKVAGKSAAGKQGTTSSGGHAQDSKQGKPLDLAGLDIQLIEPKDKERRQRFDERVTMNGASTYEGQELQPDAESTLVLISGRESVVRALKKLIEECVRGQTSNSATRFHLPAKFVTFLTIKNKKHYTALLRSVVGATENPMDLAQLEKRVKIDFPPRWKMEKVDQVPELVIRGETELVNAAVERLRQQFESEVNISVTHTFIQHYRMAVAL
jgi:hypothetical protein